MVTSCLLFQQRDTTVKRNRKGSKRRSQTIQVWTYDQALRVLPYVAAIMRSLRESYLQALPHSLKAKRLASRPGRPDRTRLIAHATAVEEVRQAQERLQEAIDDLQTLDIFCLDPLQGQALIPFEHNRQLAWFIYDLFDNKPLRYWRYHEDPLETRRPIAEALEESTETPLAG
jgi:hypothetical protein